MLPETVDKKNRPGQADVKQVKKLLHRMRTQDCELVAQTDVEDPVSE
jgi:hypothetical protein